MFQGGKNHGTASLKYKTFQKVAHDFPQITITRQTDRQTDNSYYFSLHDVLYLLVEEGKEVSHDDKDRSGYSQEDLADVQSSLIQVLYSCTQDMKKMLESIWVKRISTTFCGHLSGYWILIGLKQSVMGKQP